MTYSELMEKVENHHKLVKELGYTVVFTALIGSQNYGLDDGTSDIDTFSLTLPSIEDLAAAEDPVAGEFEVKDGKCMYKDIRVALNLLKKASPNSTEMFSTKYKYINPEYKELVDYYLTGKPLQLMIHCNYSHMLYACAGMAHQLTKRNMPAGKRYAHALRLNRMVKVYTNTLDVKELFMLPGSMKTDVLKVKRDRDPENEERYNKLCEYIAEKLDQFKEEFYLSEEKEGWEKLGTNLVENFQLALMKKYLGVNE